MIRLVAACGLWSSNRIARRISDYGRLNAMVAVARTAKVAAS
jgi:hypothetical protein